MGSVILFDGEKDIEVSKEDIHKLSATDLVSLYKKTATFHDLINDLGENIALGLIPAVNDIKISPYFIEQLGDGWAALRSEIVDRFGQDSADLIFEEVKQLLKVNKADE